jgi:hypothetical protein
MEGTNFWSEDSADAAQSSDPDSVVAARLIGRDVYLRAVTPADYAFIQQIEMSSSIANRWRFRGKAMSPAEWAQAFWRDVLVQHMIIERKRDEAVGLAFAYRSNFQDGHTHIAALRFTSHAAPLMLFGVALFIDHVFTCWNFRKLYLETPEYNYGQIASGVGRWFEIEARLREHRFYGGRYWDELILAMTRETWMKEGKPIADAQWAPKLRRVQVRMPAEGQSGA